MPNDQPSDDYFPDNGAAADGPLDDTIAKNVKLRKRAGLGMSHQNKNNNKDSDNGIIVEQEHAIIKCNTSAGTITMHLHRNWSPHGYDRATTLFERGYYDHSHFFRVVPHFLVQFGISYTSNQELKHLADQSIRDDPKKNELLPFREGYMSFAGSGPNSRTSQLFFAYDRAGGLGQSPWETPFGEVVDGMDHVRNLYSGYGDMPPWGKGPQQGPIRNRGSSYIEEGFPLLDKFETCTVKRTKSLDGDDNEEEESTNEEQGLDNAVVDTETKLHVVAAERRREEAKKMIPNLQDDVEVGKPFPLFGKIVVIVVVLGIVSQLISRRRRRKRHRN